MTDRPISDEAEKASIPLVPVEGVTKSQRAFLAAFVESGGFVASAARAAGQCRANHWRWLKESEIYARAFRFCEEEAVERLEREATRRGVDGWDEAVFYEGRQVGTKRRYSDTLLIFRLKGERPAKYAEFSVRESHVTGEVTHSTPVDARSAALDSVRALRDRRAISTGGDPLYVPPEDPSTAPALDGSDDEVIDAEIM